MTPTEMHIDALMEKIEKLEAKNARLREALERIDNECSRDDTIAWKIANDALEELK
jgi:predicted RNase H-like nuclease (RuvC/YqgF family)